MASKKSASYDVSLYSYNEIVKGTEKQGLEAIRARYTNIVRVSDAAAGAKAYLGGKIAQAMSDMKEKNEAVMLALSVKSQSTVSTYKNYFLSVQACGDLYNVPIGQGLILGKEGVRQYLPEVLRNRHFWQDMDDTDLRAYLNLVIEAKGDTDRAFHNIGKNVRGTGRANTSGSGGSGNVKTGTDAQEVKTNITIGAPPAESAQAPAEKSEEPVLHLSPSVRVLGAIFRRFGIHMDDTAIAQADFEALITLASEIAPAEMEA